MPRTEGVSSSSRVRCSLLRPRPTSVSRWSWRRAIGLFTWVTRTRPAAAASLSNWRVMQVLIEAGLPPGVINMLPGDGLDVSKVALTHPDLAGIHFTGSTPTFQHLWRTVGENISGYRSYPRIVGETGGKDFIVAHPSADPDVVRTAMIRGAFEFQGQKCSACSRIYVPKSIWPEVRDRMLAMIADIRMGDVNDFRNFMGAVIDGLIVDVVKRLGATAVSITHDMASARRIGDDAAMIHKGRIVWTGAAAALGAL